MNEGSTTHEDMRRRCIMGEPYRGHRSPWCGDGLVLFVGADGNEIRGTSSKQSGWLEEAWAMAKEEIDERIAK